MLLCTYRGNKCDVVNETNVMNEIKWRKWIKFNEWNEMNIYVCSVCICVWVFEHKVRQSSYANYT